ncbi:MAG: choice-of-anchor D domain-containing protein [Myxococcota bacterium]|nr:choice-of-anchor D domain-containing protein [Myxococcota bacterium]
MNGETLRTPGRLPLLGARLLLCGLPLGLVGLTASGCDSADGYKAGGVVQIYVTPSESLQFPATKVGNDADVEVTIASQGKKDLVVSKLALEPASTHFRIVPTTAFDPASDLPLTLEPGLERSFTVRYSPQPGEELTAVELVIGSNDRVLPELRLPLEVQSFRPQLERTPSLLTWGYDDPRPTNLGCDEIRGRQSFTVRNGGSGELFLSGYPLAGKGLPEGEQAADHFSVCPPASWNLPLRTTDSQQWDVVFHPQTAGQKSATLTLQSDGGSATVELIGGGEGRSSLEVNPLVLAWPELQEGQSGVKTLELVNTGSIPIDVTLIRVEPSIKRQFYSLDGATFQPAEDDASGKLSQSIPKNGSARLEVTYSARQPVAVQATLEIYHSASTPTSPVLVALEGNSATPQLLVDPPQVLFSGTGLGASQSRTLLVRNGGSAVLEISKIDIGPDGEALGAENFSCGPGDCSASLAPGEFESFTVTYTRPADAVQLEDRACANVHSNDPALQPAKCVSLYAKNLEGNTRPVGVITTDPENTTVDVGTPVSLSCADSTDVDDGQTISRCDWLLTYWPAGSRATLSATTGDPATPVTLTPDAAGTYRVALVVTDSSAVQFVSQEVAVEINAR